jgi:hypothetical protein
MSIRALTDRARRLRRWRMILLVQTIGGLTLWLYSSTKKFWIRLSCSRTIELVSFQSNDSIQNQDSLNSGGFSFELTILFDKPLKTDCTNEWKPVHHRAAIAMHHRSRSIGWGKSISFCNIILLTYAIAGKYPKHKVPTDRPAWVPK